ncbi:hypothetical protein PL11201_680113 [Planktothrix sp. PCC 11201]|nr:hypothetical protein PL11201_680113 [Planktothrix sp. PCC 11201]
MQLEAYSLSWSVLSFQSLKGIIGYCNQLKASKDMADSLFQSLKGIIGYCNQRLPLVE